MVLWLSSFQSRVNGYTGNMDMDGCRLFDGLVDELGRLALVLSP